MTIRIPQSAIRILLALWRINVAEELQYRANLVASLLGTVFWIVTALLTLAVFFRHTTRLGDWDYWEVVVLLGVFNTLTGVIEAVLRPGIGRLAGEVKNGGLDLVLAKPVDAQGFVSFRRLDVWRFTDVVLGLTLAGYALYRLGRAPSPAQLAAFGLTLAAAVVVVYALWVALMSLAFWFVSVENLSVLFDAVYEGARYPVSAYAGTERTSSSGSDSGAGGFPVSISCTNTPTANMSSAGPAAAAPFFPPGARRSGATYVVAHSAPVTSPGVPRGSERSTASTMPVSATSVWPSVSRTFSGFRSPWAMCAACA